MRRGSVKAMLDSVIKYGAGRVGALRRLPRGGTAWRPYQRAARTNGFALYEVLLGVTIFAFGVLALGRAVENCLNASTLSAEENAVRQILSNRMAEIQGSRAFPDQAKEFKIDSGYGVVKLIQKSLPAELTEPNKTMLNG